ncbi:Os03g0147150 [Oryza sativa Japonica Group]|uniref:Os03g0147150 protein n=1 Tax=Oryza sativa subsp. japonica TaxID=39947 RepID=A0A0P0VT22_ORYSJ|nr:Os03g0147150 [Oryza sativa Japonica Group]
MSLLPFAVSALFQREARRGVAARRRGGAGKAADLAYWESAARMIADSSRSSKVVVEKSTVPVKTAEAIEKILAHNAHVVEFQVLSNLEFLAEGTAVADLRSHRWPRHRRRAGAEGRVRAMGPRRPDHHHQPLVGGAVQARRERVLGAEGVIGERHLRALRGHRHRRHGGGDRRCAAAGRRFNCGGRRASVGTARRRCGAPGEWRQLKRLQDLACMCVHEVSEATGMVCARGIVQWLTGGGGIDV